MKVLGIDPGLRVTGYAALRFGRGVGKPAIVEAGVIRLARTAKESEGESPKGPGVSARLLELEAELAALLDRVEPATVAVEAIFSHAAFPRTATIMGHARGVVLLTIARRGLRLVEVPPAKVKRHATGSGTAKKEQMQRAMQGYFGLAQPPAPHDVADALAIALYAGHTGRLKV
jgi:crossover junction endodeoxyribonuclease RuvC